MKLALLGPLKVESAHGPVVLGAAKERALLGALGMRRAQAVSVDSLIDALWGVNPPPSSGRTLQTYVSHLRRVLPAGLLETVPGGYRLAIGTEDVDIARFESLFLEGRRLLASAPGEASVRLSDALALWRGEALVEVASESWCRAEITRLEEMRRGAEEDLAAARLANGEHEILVAELEALVAASPLRERRWALLMVALARSGRQAEALRAFQRARSTLIEELGLEPGGELRRLEEAVLAQEPGLGSAPAPAAAGHWALSSPAAGSTSMELVGRSVHRARLESALHRSRSALTKVAVRGEAGVGKTTLVSRFADEAARAGVSVMWGACDPQLRFPLQPWIDAIRRVARAMVPQLGPLAAELALILPLPDVEPAAQRADDQDALPARLCEAVLAVLELASRVSPVLLVIDDVQWADPASLRMVRFLTRHGSDLRLLLVTVAREDVPPDPALGEVLAVESFSLEETSALVSSFSPDFSPSKELLLRLQDATAGNAFFLTELVSLIASGRALPELDASPPITGLPPLVSSAIELRTRELADPARRTLEAAAILGRRFDVATLTAITALSEAATVRSIEACLHARLVVEMDELDQFRFRHDLTRHHLLAGMSGARRARLHLAAAGAVSGQHALVRRAEHLLDAGTLIPPAQLLEAVLEAGCTLVGVGGHEQAAQLYQRALPTVRRLGDGLALARLLAPLARALAASEHPNEARKVLLEAVGLARELGEPSVVVETALVHEVFESGLTPDPDHVELLRSAVGILDDNVSLERVLALRLLAYDERQLGHRDVALALLDEADACAALSDDPSARLAAALARHLHDRTGSTPVATRFERSCAVVSVAVDSGDLHGELRARANTITDALECGQLDLAEHQLESYGELAQRTRDRRARWITAMGRGLIAQCRGLHELADHLAGEAFELGNRLEVGLATGGLGAHTFVSSWLQGRLGHIVDQVEMFAARFPGAATWELGAVLARLEGGDTAGARDRYRAIGDLTALPDDWLRPVALVLAAQVAFELEDRPTAAVLLPLLAPWLDRFIVLGAAATCVGPVKRVHGLLEATTGDRRSAIGTLTTTATWCDASSMRCWGDLTADDLQRLGAGGTVIERNEVHR